MFAKVIVDVPAKQTNRAFDYAVPEPLRNWIEIGSRVGVPFGPRTIQGFVTALTPESDADPAKLKPIGQVLDPTPPLTEELVRLAQWMSEKYVCHEIIALQAMLPGALKAKYERIVTLGDGSAEGLPLVATPDQQQLLADLRAKDGIAFESLAAKYPAEGAWIKEMIRSGVLREEQTIKDRLSKKKALIVTPLLRQSQLEELAGKLPPGAIRQKDVLAFFSRQPAPVALAELLRELGASASTVRALEERGALALRDVEVQRDPYAARTFAPSVPLPLTDEQRRAFVPISEAVTAAEHAVFLLHGVTGSGKTEVYLQTIAACMAGGREAVVLVPEISLTPQMVERFKSRFGDRVAVMHSRLSQGERYDEWRKIVRKQVSVVIGARSAVFAPFTKLGLIVIDEEHESSYKQEESPKYHARDVAIERARMNGAVVVLGSATPSLESFARASGAAEEQDGAAGAASGESALWVDRTPVRAYGNDRPTDGDRLAAVPDTAPDYRLLTLSGRALGRPLPPVRVVDMRAELRDGNRTMFSRPLYKALQERLQKKEQTVLLLNRRGYSTFVMCRSCGYTVGCPHCDIKLTYHQNSRMVRCHYCGHAEREPRRCPNCDSEHIRFFGTGTQRVEEELARHFPGIRVIRMDVDTTTEKGSHEKWLTMFGNKQADVLLGTQMVAKGLDFPDVTLVGVIAADTVLNLPDFRAAERTFQLLTQVAGRAGRHTLPGEVIVQTYTPEHYSIGCASGHDYGAFARIELQARRLRGYPPFYELALITLSHEQLPLLVRTAESLVSRLKELAAASGLKTTAPDGDMNGCDLDIMGPVASPIPRIKDRYRFQCTIKYRRSAPIPKLIRDASAAFDDLVRQQKLQIAVDIDPQLLM